MNIQIKTIFGDVIFEFNKIDNTFRGTVLEAIEKNVNLSSANLRYADLRSADLSSANLRYASLNSAVTDKRYIQVAGIGSVKRMTTYCFEDDKIWCGCFTGTLAEFETKVKETHENNKQYLDEYLGFINYLRSLK